MATLQRRSRPNGHTHEVAQSPGDMQCPTCSSPITAAKWREIQGSMRAHDSEIERAVAARFARDIAQMEASRKREIEKAVKDAVAGSEKKLRLVRQNQDAVIAARVQAERDAAAKKLSEAVAAERLQHASEKLRLEAALGDMQRRLAAKPAHQIGEPAEVDLFDALVGAFPQDRIERVKKGAKGPDILLEIVHLETVVGKIILDSKAVSRWSNKFPAKLRADQLAYGADFGVLVSTSFPTGAGELHLQDNIVVVSPTRAVVLVQLLRRHVVETHRLRITGRARNEKAEALLAYIVSPEANDLIERFGKAAHDIIDLDAREVDQHQGIWRRRGELVRIVQKAHEDLTAAIDRIIDGTAAPDAVEEVAA